MSEAVEQVSTAKDESQDKIHGRKRSAKDIDVSQVHSANAWESAELGDDERKMKFLKLMGAGKKEHQGKIVIGDQKESSVKTSAATKDPKLLCEDLEDQYKHSMEHKLMGPKKHRGLGFHEEDAEDQVAQSDENTGDSVLTQDEELNIVASAAARGNSSDNNSQGDNTTKPSSEKNSANENTTENQEKCPRKMAFVKGSS